MQDVQAVGQTQTLTFATRLQRVLGSLFAALVTLYALAIYLYLAARLLWGESRFALIALANSLMPALLLPALLLVAVALLFRRWREVGVLLPILLLFGIGYGELFLPNASAQTAAPGTPQVTVLTYNLHSDPRILDEQLALIRNANADIVALQELIEPMAARLDELDDLYPYQTLHPDGLTVRGQGILSRYPLDDVEFWINTMGQIRAEVQLPEEQNFVLYDVHPPPPGAVFNPRLFNTTARADAISDILARAAEETAPVLLAGDFNMTDQSDDYQRVTGQYSDTFREVGWGLGMSFPNLGFMQPRLGLLPPFVRIDYVFHDSGFIALNAVRWGTSGGSDHYPVLVTLGLGDGE